MDTEFILQVHPDGRRFAIYSDKLPLQELGHITTKRASNVEHNDKTQEWEVTLIGEETPRFANKSRQECIKWEVAHIEGRMTEIMLQHFPRAA
jgi:hypothetical protein